MTSPREHCAGCGHTIAIHGETGCLYHRGDPGFDFEHPAGGVCSCARPRRSFVAHAGVVIVLVRGPQRSGKERVKAIADGSIHVWRQRSWTWEVCCSCQPGPLLSTPSLRLARRELTSHRSQWGSRPKTPLYQLGQMTHGDHGGSLRKAPTELLDATLVHIDARLIATRLTHRGRSTCAWLGHWVERIGREKKLRIRDKHSLCNDCGARLEVLRASLRHDPRDKQCDLCRVSQRRLEPDGYTPAR